MLLNLKDVFIAKLILSSFFIVGILSFTHADPIADLANSKCTKCHSADAEYARIEGQNSEYILLTMQDYKANIRTNEQIKRMLKYDDATLKALADYFSKLARAPGIKGDAALITQGKELYYSPVASSGLKSCADCHGKTGEGSGFGDSLNPMLSGQLKDFVISQMKLYKSGKLKHEDMNNSAKLYTEDQILALAEYIQSL